jgi:hypothetical protein
MIVNLILSMGQVALIFQRTVVRVQKTSINKHKLTRHSLILKLSLRSSSLCVRVIVNTLLVLAQVLHASQGLVSFSIRQKFLQAFGSAIRGLVREAAVKSPFGTLPDFF